MSRNRNNKQRRAARVEAMIQREIAQAETILDQIRTSKAFTRYDNEPKALTQAFAEIEKREGGASNKR